MSCYTGSGICIISSTLVVLERVVWLGSNKGVCVCNFYMTIYGDNVSASDVICILSIGVVEVEFF